MARQQVTTADTYWRVYNQNSARISDENFLKFRPHIPRKRKAYRNDKAKEQAWKYACELVERTEKEGADPGYALVRIEYHKPGQETREVWKARGGVDDEKWARMLATARKERS